jgi:hypothetical protein
MITLREIFMSSKLPNIYIQFHQSLFKEVLNQDLHIIFYFSSYYVYNTL